MSAVLLAPAARQRVSLLLDSLHDTCRPLQVWVVAALWRVGESNVWVRRIGSFLAEVAIF